MKPRFHVAVCLVAARARHEECGRIWYGKRDARGIKVG